MSLFPYPTISSWFEENGDFPENLEDPRSPMEVLGDEEDAIEPGDHDWPTSEDVAPCIDNGGHLKTQRHTEDECPQEDGYDPCCFTNHLNGGHDWDCFNK